SARCLALGAATRFALGAGGLAIRARLRRQDESLMAASSPLPIDVAVGILMKPNGDVLLGRRPEGKPYAGYWEFPGGKVETGESILDALKREFVEELGMQVMSAEPWCGVEHVYPHAHVRLHFYISRDWQGEPQSLEGQALAWQGSVG